MNSAERKFLYLALFLFALGGVSRFGLFNKISPMESVFLPPVNEEVVLDTLVIDSIIDTVNTEDVAEVVKYKKEKKPKKKAPAFPLAINTASNEDLCFIKGVGPSLAQKIIDYREKNGNFHCKRFGKSSRNRCKKTAGYGRIREV